MFSKIQTKKNKNCLNKIKSNSLLSNIFSFISKEKSIKIAQINKKLLSSLNLKIDDYYLDKNYQKIILDSKGYINNIYEKSYHIFKKDDSKSKSFVELTSNIIKYLKYLYLTKKIKSFKLVINGNTFIKWTYFLFSIEIIRNLKYGLCLQINPKLKYKYFELIKDSIHNLEEIKSIEIHSFKSENENYIDNYMELFDWTKVRCLNFTNVINRRFAFQENINNIPNNASFYKLYIDEDKFINTKKLITFFHKHGSHIEHLKIYNFSDKVFSTRHDFEIFQDLNKLKCVKFIKCQHLTLFNFILFFKNNISSIQKLILDNINESEKGFPSFTNAQYNSFVDNIKNLTHLAKFEINFKSTSESNALFKNLSIIINLNPNLKQLKITLDIKPKIKKNEINNLKNFINFDSLNSINNEKLENEINAISEINEKRDEFIDFIKAISSLKNLTKLQLIINMNDRMTKIFNNFFNVGNNLRSLEIIHTGNFEMTQLFMNHPKLDDINFKLICKENDIKVGNEDDKFSYYKLSDYEYDFPLRSWKNIVLNYYPINDSLINTLIGCKKSLKQLKLNKTINLSKKSNEDIYNILLEISNNYKK